MLNVMTTLFGARCKNWNQISEYINHQRTAVEDLTYKFSKLL
jgi:hypothetical protein